LRLELGEYLEAGVEPRLDPIFPEGPLISGLGDADCTIKMVVSLLNILHRLPAAASDVFEQLV